MRDLPFRERNDAHTEECQTLEKAGGVFLVTAEAIERFGEDDIEFAVEGAAHQRLESWPQQRGAGNSVVVEFIDHCPAFTVYIKAADANLIGDGGIALVVG